MGRPRGSGAPTALKLLKGPGRHPETINRDEPIPEEGIPECPTKDAEVRAVWDYTVKQLTRMRTITMADRDALHTYCEQVVQYRKACDMVREDGPIIIGPTGAKKHPGLSIMRETGAMIKMFGQNFGLTPSARSAIKVADQQPAKQTQADPSRLLSG
jgi:P27 family predicted phage terminase small subunit